jgi:hypothetical protein
MPTAPRGIRTAYSWEKDVPPMTKQLVTICLMVILAGLFPPFVHGQKNKEYAEATLKDIIAVCVAVESLPDSAKVIILAKEAIQTDVELKLRLAGMRVVTQEQSLSIFGRPCVYVNVTLLQITDGKAQAANVKVELIQKVKLVRNEEIEEVVPTWEAGSLISTPNPTAEWIRDEVKDQVDKFLNAWLSVNPPKK